MAAFPWTGWQLSLEYALHEAKALKLNLSATFEAALLNELKAARRDKWIAENKQAIETCNKLANEHRLFADKHREF